MPMRTWLAIALLSLLTACDATLSNSGQVYPPVSGAVTVRWRQSVEGIAKVDFLMDGKPLGTDATADDGFAIELDSTTYPEGLHVLKLVATAADGAIVQVIEHTLLFHNQSQPS